MFTTLQLPMNIADDWNLQRKVIDPSRWPSTQSNETVHSLWMRLCYTIRTCDSPRSQVWICWMLYLVHTIQGVIKQNISTDLQGPPNHPLSFLCARSTIMNFWNGLPIDLARIEGAIDVDAFHRIKMSARYTKTLSLNIWLHLSAG